MTSSLTGSPDDPASGSAVHIDADLYSRQIGTFGMETMGKLLQLKVLISGLNGAGAECAKNLILAGPKSVLLHDPEIVTMRDLGSNFCLCDPEVFGQINNGKLTRAAASRPYLSALNSYVHVEVMDNEINKDVLKEVQCLILFSNDVRSIIRLNNLCRELNVIFMACSMAGLASMIFCDYGEKFTCLDIDGEEPKTAIVAGISMTDPQASVQTCTVYTHTDRVLPFSAGDYVQFREVQGMEEVNIYPHPIRIEKILSKHSFSMELDTSKYKPYVMGGICKQVKMPLQVHCAPYGQSMLKPVSPQTDSLIVPDLAKFGRPEQLHLAFSAALLYASHHSRVADAVSLCEEKTPLKAIPHPVLYSHIAKELHPSTASTAEKEAMDVVEECYKIAQALCHDMRQASAEPATATSPSAFVVEEIDRSIIKYVVSHFNLCLTPMAAFVGGVIAQEVVKVTGKYMPLKGFLYLDAFECIGVSTSTEDSNSSQDCNMDKTINLRIGSDESSSAEDAICMPKLTDSTCMSTYVSKEFDNLFPKTVSELLTWRYADFVGVFGLSPLIKLMKANLFIVGAGALGCELLKSFALLGLSTNPQNYSATAYHMDPTKRDSQVCDSMKNGTSLGSWGSLTITDMDRIEVSNLNRQFLFRREHVGKAKSITAAAAATLINPGLQVNALEHRVGAETEATVFTDEFWIGQDVIVNALDNIQARQYVDSRCVAFGLPLLESGTLGTKGNVQVVLPRLTQCYSDSVDPPEESIPLCTLRHFPHQIEHTIEWARDSFQGTFTGNFMEAKSFSENPEQYLEKLHHDGTVTTQLQRLKDLYKIYEVFLNPSNVNQISFKECVSLAVNSFHQLFNIQILQLLSSFPPDHRTRSGALFWTPPKRSPTAIPFDANNERHLQFVISAANLYAFCYGLPAVRDATYVQSLAQQVVLPEYIPGKAKIVINENEEGENQQAAAKAMDTSLCSLDGDIDAEIRQLQDSLLALHKKASSCVNYQPIEFEKDDDTNYHIDFIHAAASIRADNYNIETCNRMKTKQIAGRIIPAIATTTAMVTGLVSLEILKTLLLEKKNIADFKNAFINLALPLWIFTEPMGPKRITDKDYDPVIGGPMRAIPNGFTCWDQIEINKPGCTVQQLCETLQEHFEVNVDILSVGNYCLFNSFLPAHKKQRYTQPVVELVEQIAKTSVQSRVFIETSCNSQRDQVDVLLPTICLKASRS